MQFLNLMDFHLVLIVPAVAKGAAVAAAGGAPYSNAPTDGHLASCETNKCSALSNIRRVPTRIVSYYDSYTAMNITNICILVRTEVSTV